MREEALGREWPYPLVGQLVGIRKSHDKAQANAPKLLDPARYHLNPRTDLNDLEKGRPWRATGTSLVSSNGSTMQVASIKELHTLLSQMPQPSTSLLPA